MEASQKGGSLLGRLLDPFFLAIFLNVLVIGASLLLVSPPSETLFKGWLGGFNSLMAFAMQMILMLSLGHAIAISPLALKRMEKLASWIANRRYSAFWVTLFTGLICWLQWGIGLIAGGILARRVAEANPDKRRHHLIRYTAAAYGGFIVWHGGWSGSAPLKVATPNHFMEATMGVIPVGETLLSGLNIALLIGVLLLGGISIVLLPAKEQTEEISPPSEAQRNQPYQADYGLGVGLVILLGVLSAFILEYQAIDLVFIIVVLFALGLILHGNIEGFSEAVKDGLSGTLGILLQFPLYGAIMGVMKSTGLAVLIAESLLKIATPELFLPLTFLSAGLLNIVVPSGGGQWAVQAPVIIPMAQELGVNLAHTVVAFSWGDAWTNLIQPFWALPLLAMTQAKAKELFPLTAMLCLITGGAIVGILMILG